MTLSPKHIIRKSLVVAAVTAAVAASFATRAETGDAAVNSTLESVVGTATCNSATRTMAFGVSIQLGYAYPDGAWVAYRFRLYQVNSAGARVSAFGYDEDDWVRPRYVDTIVTYLDVMGPYNVNHPVYLDGGSRTWLGRWNGDVQVAVWDPRAGWTYTNWIPMAKYTNHYPAPGGLGMETADWITSCLTQW